MPRPHDGTTCETLAVRIEALVDGELEAAEKASLTRHFAVCPDCARQYRLALVIRHELQAMPELDAPAHLLDSAVELSRQQPSSRGSWTRYLQLPRPAWIALGAAAAVLLSILVLVLDPTPIASTRSAEVERATEEARLALAYLDKVTHRAARDLSEDVVKRRVVEPVTRGLTRSLNPEAAQSHDSGPVSDCRLPHDTTRSS